MAPTYTDHAEDEQHQVRTRCRSWFVNRLYGMLERAEEDGITDIIAWQPHGRCFIIHDGEKLEEILPQYFKISKKTSLLRQLNIYGFTRILRGPDSGGYYHELFLRGKRWLAQKIKVKETGVRTRANPDPKLWEYSWVKKSDDEESGEEQEDVKNQAKAEESVAARPVVSSNEEAVEDEHDRKSESQESSPQLAGSDSEESAEQLAANGLRLLSSISEAPKEDAPSTIAVPTTQYNNLQQCLSVPLVGSVGSGGQAACTVPTVLPTGLSAMGIASNLGENMLLLNFMRCPTVTPSLAVVGSSSQLAFAQELRRQELSRLVATGLVPEHLISQQEAGGSSSERLRALLELRRWA